MLRKVIREEGMSAIVVEQKARKILGFTDRAVILDRGRIVFAGDSAALASDPERLETHLGVTEQKKAAVGARRPGCIDANDRCDQEEYTRCRRPRLPSAPTWSAACCAPPPSRRPAPSARRARSRPTS